MTIEYDLAPGRGAKIDDSQLPSVEEYDLNGKYCNYFFQRVEINAGGKVFMCCPNWLPYSIGHLNSGETLAEIWNGERAQNVRAQLYDGKNWPLCKHKSCPKIQGRRLPSLDNIRDPRYNRFITDFEVEAVANRSTVADILPNEIQLGTDESCNLYCPSCRSSKILHATGDLYEQKRAMTERVLDELFSTPDDYDLRFWITGGGDPFGSKIYREILQTLDLSKRTRTVINLQTNGVMLTPKIWDSMKNIHHTFESIYVSYDAATKDTYENKVRLGGHWDVLMDNVDYVFANMQEHTKISHCFVVQQDNYKEIPDFVRMCLDRWDDGDPGLIQFSLILDWGVMPSFNFEQKAIWKPTHSEHNEFLKVLSDPILTEYKNRIDMGNMQAAWEQANA